MWAWPREGKKGIDGFAAEDANAALLPACAWKGVWDAVEGNVRIGPDEG